MLIENGVNALTLIPSPPLTEQTLTRAIILLEANFGVEYSQEKILLLFRCMKEDNWTEERFMRTFGWFIRNKPFATWTVADWYTWSGIRVYPYEWMLEQVHKFGGGVNSSLERYLLPDGKTLVYKYKDGQELPLEKWDRTKSVIKETDFIRYKTENKNQSQQSTNITPKADKKGINHEQHSQPSR
jgi:hypothetical protein